MSSGSAHKINRNNHYRIELSGTSYVTATVVDNGFINRILPFYKESIDWFKKYLPSTSFIQYVLYSATHTGSTLAIPQQAVTISSSPAYYEYRLVPNDSLYDNLNYKSYQGLRLADKAKIKIDKKNTEIYFENVPVIHNKVAQGGRYFDSHREPPLDYASELIKYNIDGLIDGFTPVFESDFAHEELNTSYNVQNRKRKYEKLTAIFELNKNVQIKHKQTVFPNQNDIWNRTRPYFTFSSWIDKQALRQRDNSYEYEYSNLNSMYSVTPYEYVTTLLQSDSDIYVAGIFTYLFSPDINRGRIFSVYKETNILKPFNPDASDNIVYALALSGSNLYIGGSFTTVSGSTRNNLCVVDKDSGALGPFNPNVSPSVVRTLLLSGSNLYIGGNFTTVSGTTRNRIAVVDKDSGALGPFDPNASTASSYVYTLLLSGSNLYVGGNFTTISGSTRNGIAVVNKDSGALGPFDPNVTIISTGVRTVFLSGSNLYIGGNFSNVSGSARNNLAVVDKDSGALGPFNPNCNSVVHDLKLSGSNIYAGGQFTTISGVAQPYIGAVNKDSGYLDSTFAPTLNNYCLCIMTMSNNLHIGGQFTNINEFLRYNYAIIDSTSGTLNESRLGDIFTERSDKPSIWPLDAWKRAEGSYVFGEYMTGSSFAVNSDYKKPFNFLYYGLYEAFWTGSYLASSSIWTVPEETNSFPFFNNENDYIHHIKPKYKDHSPIPEYLVSNFINDFSLNTGTYDLYISGTLLGGGQPFTNNNSENKNIFNIKKDINKEITQIEFKLNYVNLFRPYRNLYPVEKILQLSKILSNRITSGTIGDYTNSELTIESQSAVKNFLLEPFVSPGILWNTIKTGVPAIWPYLTSTNRTSASVSFPFESIYNPLKYLNNTYMNSYYFNINSASYSGSFSDQKYTDCITNFINDSTDFFLNTDLTYFSSKPESTFDTFLAGTTYGLLLSLDNYFETSSFINASSISASPHSLGFTYFVGGDEFSLNCPPYLKFYQEYSGIDSPPTFNKLKILFTPTVGGRYTLSEIISSSVISKELTDNRWIGNQHVESVREYGQNLLKSYNIFTFEKLGDTDRIWSISGKWEVPIFDFRNAVSKQVYTQYPYLATVIGYGHQFGTQQNEQANLTLNISDVSGTFSLADMVGFKDRTYQLGKLKQQQEVSELICIVPMNTSNNSLFSIAESHVSYLENINYFDWFMFPVEYDYKYGTAKPYLMYCFETKMTLDSDDLSKIWQNVMPSKSFNHEEGSLTIRDNIVDNPQLNDLFEDGVTWMIFKIKQKSLTNIEGKHTFNWPYENFSITEMARLDVELGYATIVNDKRRDDPSIIGQKNKRQPRVIEIVDVKETNKRKLPTKDKDDAKHTYDEEIWSFSDPTQVDNDKQISDEEVVWSFSDPTQVDNGKQISDEEVVWSFSDPTQTDDAKTGKGGSKTGPGIYDPTQTDNAKQG